MKNKELKDLLIFNLICVISFIIISMFISNLLYNKYDKYQTEVKNEIVLNHPELSEDIVNILNNKDYNFKKLIIKYNLTISIVSLLSLLVINFLYIRKCLNKVNNINYYIENILNDDYSKNIDEFCNGDICELKKNIILLVTKLKYTNMLLDLERHKLEQILDDLFKQMRLANTNIKVNDKSLVLKNQKQVERIEMLLSSLIKLAKLDSGTIKIEPSKIKLSSLISKSIEPLKEIIINKNIEVKLNIRNTDVYVDVSLMSEAIYNILKNACQYTKDEILIESTTNDEFTQIKISNNGSLIDSKDLPYIFDKFNNKGAESLGIGLNLTKEIITRHNAAIEVLNNDRTTFVINLYKKCN